MLLASYVAGLIGVVGKRVRYLNPQSIQQAVQFALSVQEGEKQESFNNSFIRSLKIRLAYSQEYSESERSRYVDAARTVNHTLGQRPRVPRSANNATASGTRNEQTKEALRCYECECLGHYAKKCPTRITYGVTGEVLDVKGRQTVSFMLGGQQFHRSFFVCSPPTETAGILST